MARAIGPLYVEGKDDLAERLKAAEADSEDLGEPERGQIHVARLAAEALIESGAALDGPYEVSLSIHAPAEKHDVTDRPYVSVSVVGAVQAPTHEPERVTEPRGESAG